MRQQWAVTVMIDHAQAGIYPAILSSPKKRTCPNSNLTSGQHASHADRVPIAGNTRTEKETLMRSRCVLFLGAAMLLAVSLRAFVEGLMVESEPELTVTMLSSYRHGCACRQPRPQGVAQGSRSAI